MNMTRLVDAVQYAIKGGGSGVRGAQRAELIELALRALRLNEAVQTDESRVGARDNAFAALHAACKPEVIYRLAAGDYLPLRAQLGGVDAWVWRTQRSVRELVRSLWSEYAEIEERFERQRETIYKANVMAMRCMGGDWYKRRHSPDPTDGLATMVGVIAEERDAFKQLVQRLTESNEELRARLEGFRDTYTEEHVAASTSAGGG